MHKIHTTTLKMSYAQNIPMLKLKCKDAGFDCKFVAKGKTEDEIMQKAAEHAMKDHGIKPEDLTAEMKAKIKSLIHKSLF